LWVWRSNGIIYQNGSNNSSLFYFMELVVLNKKMNVNDFEAS
jgi:hypothetical protein